MKKIVCGLEYDGTRYHGWQRQRYCRSVQAAVERALSEIANERIQVQCAGRTDTGVHAVGQVIHFETHAERPDKAWVLGTNSHLPHDVTIQWAQPAREDFHARFAATARRYQYFIMNDSIRSSLLRSHVTWCYQPLDEARMQSAAEHLIGEHDFSSFRGVDCQSKSPYRSVEYIRVLRKGNMICIDIKANAFLHHMVRNIVGVLISIGTGKKDPEWAREVLAARKRSAGGATAPAYGLYLVNVVYPTDFMLPNAEFSSRFLLPRLFQL